MENDTINGKNNFPAFDNSSSELAATFVYDQQGALWYVITVILVYSLSMFFLIATVVKRGSRNEVTDRDVDKYLKGLDVARQTARRETVLRVRLQWPGNLITVRHGTRHGMTVSEANINHLTRTDDSDSDSEEASEASQFRVISHGNALPPEIRIHGLKDTTLDIEHACVNDEPAGEGKEPTENTSYVLLNDIEQTNGGELLPNPTTHQIAWVYQPGATRERRHGIVERSLLEYRSLLDTSEYTSYVVEIDTSAPSISSYKQSSLTRSSSLTTDGSLLSDDISLSDIEGTEISYDTENEV